MAEDIVNILNNENPKINLEITTYKNEVDLTFIQSIEAVLAVHNTDENAHPIIINSILDDINDIEISITAIITNKVDKVAGKGLSTNDLTNGLKSNYDAAYTNSHMHSNKNSLDLVSGINTGDQDLSTLANVNLSNLTFTTALSNLGFISQSLTQNGYYKFPKGLIIQWGYINKTATYQAVTFPLAFPNACFNITNAPVYTQGLPDSTSINLGTVSKTGFAYYDGNMSSSYYIYWFATGY